MRFNIGDKVVLKKDYITPDAEAFTGRPQLIKNIISSGEQLYYVFENNPKNIFWDDSGIDLVETFNYTHEKLNSILDYIRRDL